MSRIISIVDNPPILKNKRKISKMRILEAIGGYIFIAPVVLGLATFYTIPALISLWFAFNKYDGLSSLTFIGLDNFYALVKDEEFIRSVWNTLLYTIGSVPTS